MPFVRVRSLPPTRPQFDARTASGAVRAELARATGIGEEHIAVTWTAVDGAAGEYRAIADILAPDFHPAERVEEMLRSVARAVEREAGGPAFVSFTAARSGWVYDDGDVVRW
jgi:hypothetical protein